MTIFPLIARELRVRARARSVYWLRFAVAALGTIIVLPALNSSALVSGTFPTGTWVFNTLVVTGFILSCCGCVLTADQIAKEHRDGTLGLVFLTRVNAFDILLGKFGATGLTAALLLLGYLPLLVIPVLAGGVSGAEAFRKALVLVDTLFLAMSIGLYASASAHKWNRTIWTGCFMLLGVLCIPPIATLLFARNTFGRDLAGLWSPLFALSCAGDIAFRTSKISFWASLGGIHALSWGFLALATVRLRNLFHCDALHTTRKKPTAIESTVPRVWTRIRDDQNPAELLVKRQSGIKLTIWLSAILWALFQLLFNTVVRAFFYSPSMSYYSALMGYLPSFAIAIVQTSFLAWAASHFFVEASRTGELEMLAITPLGLRQLVTGQWNLLKKTARWPVVVMLLPLLVQVLYVSFRSGNTPNGWWPVYMITNVVFNALGCVLGVGAVFWMAMLFSFSKSQASTVAWTVAVVKAPAYLLSLVATLFNLVMTLGMQAYSTAATITPAIFLAIQILACIYFFVLIRIAKNRLLRKHGKPESLWEKFHRIRHWTPS